MVNQIKYSYVGLLVLSILLYGLPFEWGGYPLRLVMGLIFIVLSGYHFYITWKNTPKPVRINHLLWMINSIVLFHLVLIYVYLMLGFQYTLLIGLILGLLIYLVVSNHIKNTF